MIQEMRRARCRISNVRQLEHCFFNDIRFDFVPGMVEALDNPTADSLEKRSSLTLGGDTKGEPEPENRLPIYTISGECMNFKVIYYSSLL